MGIKRYIPNFLTLLNLFCGCIALVFVSNFKFELAFLFVCLGIFFDFFDGFFARKFGVSGPLGVQLDSLADMVTSGVVPGFTVYKMLQYSSNNLMVYLNNDVWVNSDYEKIANADFSIIPYLGFIITLGSCFRLAKFNIDTRQSDSFIGLPTPANTIFIMGIAVSNCLQFLQPIHFQIALVLISLLSAFVMNAEIPLFSLKIKDFTFKKYALQVVFLLISLVMIIFLKYLSIPLIILLYVLLSVFNNMFAKK